MRDKNTGIKVFIPCSISGFGLGKGCISVASGIPGDEIIARFSNDHQGVLAKTITGYKHGLSMDESHNSAVLAGNFLCRHLNIPEGIDLEIHKRIPVGAGLSSCAASAVGGVFAVNELLGRPMERYDLVDFAIQATRQFIPVFDDSQVLSILFGGAILSRNSGSEAFQKLYLPKGLFLTIFLPENISFVKLEFSEWVSSFPGRLLFEHAHQLSGFISALYTSNLDLMKDCFSKNNLDHSLGKAIPCYPELEQVLETTGMIGMGVAGLGPAFFVLSPNSLIAEEAATLVQNCYKSKNTELKIFQTKIDMNGVGVC